MRWQRTFPAFAGRRRCSRFREAMQRAAADSKVVAARIDVVRATFGWGAAQELVAVCDDFRASGKPLHVYLRGDIRATSTTSWAWGRASFGFAPESGALRQRSPRRGRILAGHARQAEDSPQYFMFREYKSAGEPYSRYTMSEHFPRSHARGHRRSLE
jgi:hypothetical protein